MTTSEIFTIGTSALGDRSYVLTSGATAAVIDPQRDIDRIEAVLAERGLRVTHVFETHLHNDYVTGGLELARRSGADYVLAAADEVAFDHVGARDGDEFAVGDVMVRAVHTPGHTPHHLSYVVVEEGRPVAVFTGGSMLYGTVGRTDLISADATDELSRAQFHSVRRLAHELPGDADVLPTHGFGSFCSSASTSGSDASTIEEERRSNLALTVDDEDVFVERLLAGLTVYPRYYAHMAAINRAGPAPFDLSPPEPVDPVEIRRRIHAGEWVVDLRSRTGFARGHLAGTVNLEVGDSFATNDRHAQSAESRGDRPLRLPGLELQAGRDGVAAHPPRRPARPLSSDGRCRRAPPGRARGAHGPTRAVGHRVAARQRRGWSAVVGRRRPLRAHPGRRGSARG